MDIDTDSCSSRNQRRQKAIAYDQVLHLLKESNLAEAKLPGFEDELWMHFHRLPPRYALDLNVERAEDVVMHKRLLHIARDPATRHAIDVRIVEAHFATSGNCSYSFCSNSKKKVDSRCSECCRENGARHEITISTNDKPKLFSQLSSLLSEIGLNLQEAHAFSTTDGYSLACFLVDGWALEETEQLRNTLVEKIPRIEVQAGLNQAATDDMAESECSRAVDFAPTHSRNKRLEVIAYNQVLHLLKDLNLAEANLPGFEDELWMHFHRLPPSYASNVNVKRAQDVLMHKRLLHMARDPATRLAIEVHVVQNMQAHSPTSENCRYSFCSGSQRKGDPRRSDYCGENRAMHEITISTNDKPKLLSQLTSLLVEIGLIIQEAHVFSTVDGYSLAFFLVHGWALEETDKLTNILVENVPRRIEVFPPTTWSWEI